MGSRATLFRTPPGPAIQLATKPAFHLVIKSSLNPTEIPLNLTDNPPNLTERARNQTERIAVSNAALIAKLIASKLLGSKEKDLLKLLNPPNSEGAFSEGALGVLPIHPQISPPILLRAHEIFSGLKKNNKLNFLWPKMARLGPRF